jgi:hypothetical protein
MSIMCLPSKYGTISGLCEHVSEREDERKGKGEGESKSNLSFIVLWVVGWGSGSSQYLIIIASPGPNCCVSGGCTGFLYENKVVQATYFELDFDKLARSLERNKK